MFPPKKPMMPDDPNAPMDDSAVKAQLLSKFAQMNSQGAANEMKSKYAPAPPPMPEPEAPAVEALEISPDGDEAMGRSTNTTDDVDGAGTVRTPSAGPGGAGDPTDPSLLLAMLSSEDIKKLLGGSEDLTMGLGGMSDPMLGGLSKKAF